MAHRRAIAAGEVAGARDNFGGMGAQLSNLTFILEFALMTNQGVAAKFLTEQNRELQQIANCSKSRRKPDQLLGAREVGNQKQGYKNNRKGQERSTL